MVWRTSCFGLAGCALAALIVACGGKSSGQSGSGGAASKPPASCTYEGMEYAAGESFPASDGCNSCFCEDGSVGCTEIGCGGGGVTGAQPPVSCEQTVIFYEQLLKDAKGCDPRGPNVCTLRVSDALGCGCETFVNPAQWNASLAVAFSSHYSALACNANGNCGPCRAPLRGACSVMDGCEDAYEPPPGRACKVDGTIYSDGTPGIPDPTSCNTCLCRDGSLSCTEVDCPEPCPAGTTFATSCAQCGPRLECDVVELACRPTCTDACAEGSCIDGACIADCIRD